MVAVSSYHRLWHVLPVLGAPAYQAGGQAGPRGSGGHGWGRLLGDNDGEGGVRLLLVPKLQGQGALLDRQVEDVVYAVPALVQFGGAC